MGPQERLIGSLIFFLYIGEEEKLGGEERLSFSLFFLLSPPQSCPKPSQSAPKPPQMTPRAAKWNPRGAKWSPREAKWSPSGAKWSPRGTTENNKKLTFFSPIVRDHILTDSDTRCNP